MTDPTGQKLRALETLREVSTALVVAPHHDDEILGCGGLLAQLLHYGVEVEVCFVSDGAGGAESPPDESPASDYARRRLLESELVAKELGWQHTSQLQLEDGRLAAHARSLGELLTQRLETARPDLVLLPSAAERTADHRAVHRHGLLAVQRWLRRETELLGNVLLYEVNQPLVPDLLFDVSATFDRIELAMDLYASQQERHDYLEAARGLRRYRALELPPEVELAEGYVELTYDRLRALDQETLLAQGLPERQPSFASQEAPSTPFSVIVRTRDRPDLLRAALASLAASTCLPSRVVVVNDGGAVPDLIDSDLPFAVQRIDLDPARGRAGAANAGLEAVDTEYFAFLDDDDVVAADHYEVLLREHRASAAEVVYSDAAVVQMERGADGPWQEVERSLPYARDFDLDLLLVDNYIPFHTLLLPTELVRRVGGLDPELEVFEDWDLLIRLAREAPFRHVARTTCEYRHYRDSDHHALAEPGVDRELWFTRARARVLDKHRALLSSEQLAKVIADLRRETVEGQSRQRQLQQAATGERSRLRAELSQESERSERHQRRASRAELEAQLHVAEIERLRVVESRAGTELGRLGERLHSVEAALEVSRAQVDERQSELDSVRAQLAERDGQLRAQYGLTDEHVAALRDKDEALERAFADVERLQSHIDRMEQTRAWRLHQRLERLRGRGGQRSADSEVVS